MSGLPAGKKSLPRILSNSDDADRVIDLVILLDYLLSTLRVEEGPISTRERVDREAKLFRSKGDVHFGITLRNRLAHTDSGEAPPSEEEVQRASGHLVQAVNELLPHLRPDLRAAVAGGRSANWRQLVSVVLVFFGVWQLYAVLAELAIASLGGLPGSQWFTLLLGLFVLNQFLLPHAARWLPKLTLFFRVMCASYLLGLGLAVRGIVLWNSDVTEGELVAGYTSWFAGVGELLEHVLGAGVWAFAPWLVLSRPETWEEVARLDGLSFAVFGAPLLVLLGAYLWALAPSRKSLVQARQAAGPSRWAWGSAYALGACLLVERIVHAIG